MEVVIHIVTVNFFFPQDCKPNEWFPDEWSCRGPTKTVHHCGTVTYEENSGSPSTKSGENVETSVTVLCKC